MNFIATKLRRLYDGLSIPLKKYFYFIVTVLVLHVLVDTIFFYIYWRYSLQVLLNGFLMAYVLTLPCLWLEKHKLFFRIYKIIIFIPYIISFVGDVIAHAVLDSSLDIDVASTILATNKEEALECLETYFSFTPILIGMTILGLTFLLYRKLQMFRPRLTAGWLAGVSLGLVMTILTPWSGLGGVVGKIAIFQEAQTPININRYARVAEVTPNAASQPENVVLIIGESLNKLNCSTYGYEKPTTPRLEQLKADSLLIQFNEVTSPEVHTLEVFKTLFSQYRNEWGDSVAWYTCPTLQNILHQSGYTTYWVSNQSKHGVCDNFIGQYAELCIENYFVGNKLAGMKRKTYDEEVITLLKPLIVQNSTSMDNTSSQHTVFAPVTTSSELSATEDSLKVSQQASKASDKQKIYQQPSNTSDKQKETVTRNFYVVHLMGSHFKFAKRYPKEFNHFQGEDYPNLSLRQREVVASYDNSVLYNDSVVSEIMHLFADKEAIVFYFSDHAIDLYQSSPSYYGHAKKTSESFHFGQLIPFYVYVSPKYKVRFPELVRALRARVNAPFCTDNMFYTLVDLIGTSLKDKDGVKKYSLLHIE